MTRMARNKQLPEAPLTDIEKVRARTMMRNNRIFQSLGIGAIVSMIRRSNDGQEGSAVTCDEAASAITQRGRSDYNPKDDEVTDGEEVDDIVVKKNDKVSRIRKKSAVKKISRRKGSQTSPMAPGRVFADPPEKGSKRLLEVPEPAPARVTRSKVLKVPNHEDSQVHKGQDREDSQVHKDQDHEDSQVHKDQGHEGLSLSPLGERTTRMDLILSPVREQSEQPMHDDEDEEEIGVDKPRARKGSGLERMTKSLGTKVKIQIAAGMKRPEKPLQAAKFATEGGVAARTYTPVLPHFKEYKNDATLMKDYIGKVSANFEMESSADIVEIACTDMLQKRSKNRRHLIKKKYFDNEPANQTSLKSPVPGMSDAHWQRLAELWSTPRHKRTCEKNRDNRAKVQFQQKTGSRSYAAHLYTVKEDLKGETLSAVDLFKATHHSKKDGYSEPIQKAIVEMEKRMTSTVGEGEEPKTASAIVAEVLTKECPSNTFLVNVGLESSSAKNKFRKSDLAIVAQDLKEKLVRSEMQGEAMKEELAELKKKSEEAETAQAIRDKEFELLRKKAEETDAKFAHLMAMLGSVPSGN